MTEMLLLKKNALEYLNKTLPEFNMAQKKRIAEAMAVFTLKKVSKKYYLELKALQRVLEDQNKLNCTRSLKEMLSCKRWLNDIKVNCSECPFLYTNTKEL